MSLHKDQVFLLLSSFTGLFLSCGFTYALGVYYVSFIETFNESSGLTSWIGSINYGLLCAIGPVCNVLIRRIGLGCTMMVGGLLGAAGIFSTAFATDLYTVFVTLGVITGVGLGISSLTCIVSVTCAFTKWRAAAVGLVMSGIGLGHFTHPFVITLLKHEYGWRASLVLYSALILNLLVCSMVVYYSDKSARKSTAKDCDLGETGLPLNNTKADEGGWKNKGIVLSSTNDLRSVVPLGSNPALSDPPGGVTKELPAGDRTYANKEIPARGTHDVPDCTTSHDVEESVVSRPCGRQTEPPNWIRYASLYISVILCCFGHAVVLTHVVAFAKAVAQLSDEAASSMTAAIGLASIAGRILLGLAVRVPFANVTAFFVICQLMCALSMFAYAYFTTFAAMLISASVFGFFISSFASLLNEVLIVTVGMDRFTFAYGLLTSSMAIGILGAPCAGWVYDVTGDYHYSFYLAEIAFIADASILSIGFLVWR